MKKLTNFMIGTVLAVCFIALIILVSLLIIVLTKSSGILDGGIIGGIIGTFGAIIGGALTLFGVKLTLDKQDKIRKLSIVPSQIINLNKCTIKFAKLHLAIHDDSQEQINKLIPELLELSLSIDYEFYNTVNSYIPSLLIHNIILSSKVNGEEIEHYDVSKTELKKKIEGEIMNMINLKSKELEDIYFNLSMNTHKIYL